MVLATCRRLLQTMGVDRAIGFTVIGRAWLSIAGLVTLAFVGQCLSPGEQGYYYTFGSLLALQVFVELGLTNVILQFASHERAYLNWTPRGVLEGDPDAKSRLASLLRLALRWYGIAAFAFLAVLLPAGFVFFTRCASGQSEVGWQWPWAGTVLATAGVLVLVPVLAFLEGCGCVAEVARFRVFQAIAANVALWLALLAGAGLAAASVFALANLLAAVCWLLTSQRRFLADLLAVRVWQKIAWRDEIWPYQWRIAVSWLSGYCIFQLFTPVLFAYQGPAEAGRMGMALTLAGAVSSLGASWLTTKAPRFGNLVSLRRFAELDALFLRAVKQAIGASVFGGSLVVSLVVLINAFHHPLAFRILPPLPLTLLVLATLANTLVSAEAIYLRAFKREPFVVVSLLNAALVGPWTYFVGRWSGALGMMVGYLLLGGAVGLGLGSWIFLRRRRAWHAEFRGGSESRGGPPPLRTPRGETELVSSTAS